MAPAIVILLACLAIIPAAIMLGPRLAALARRAGKRVAMGDTAQLSLSGPLALVGTVLGAVITMLIIAALFPTFADSVADVNENLTDENVTFGDETTDAIKPVFAIVVGIVALVAIVGLILAAFRGGNL